MATRKVVFLAKLLDRVKSEVQFEQLSSCKASEISTIELRKDYNNRGFCLDREPKFFVMYNTPSNINNALLLCQSPICVPEEIRSVDDLVLSWKVFVANLKHAVHSLLVVEFGQSFLASILLNHYSKLHPIALPLTYPKGSGSDDEDFAQSLRLTYRTWRSFSGFPLEFSSFAAMIIYACCSWMPLPFPIGTEVQDPSRTAEQEGRLIFQIQVLL
jgi:hypothetical protein